MEWHYRLDQAGALDWWQLDENTKNYETSYNTLVSISNSVSATAHFKGNWSSLTGALTVPASVYDSSKYWMLLEDVADVTAEVPGVSSKWVAINTGNVMGPSSATAGNVAVLDATGKVLSDGGVAPGALMPKSGGIFTGPVDVPSLNGGQLAGLRNKIINGNFGINQRAVSGTVTLAAGVYGHDRFKAGASGCTYTFATSAGITTLTISAGSLQQVIEGANLQSGTHVLSWTGTAQGKIGAGSYGASGVTGSVTGGANLTIEFGTGTLSRVQLELGSIPTPFEFLPTGLEKMLCQRYYYRINPLGAANVLASGLCTSTTQGLHAVQFPVPMRAAPTALEQSGTASDYQLRGAGTTTCSSVPTVGGATTETCQVASTVASGLTAGQGAFLRSNSGNGYLGFSAEL